MGQVHNFSYGFLTPVLSFITSCAGSALGLLCMNRARMVTGPSRWRWLTAAAVAIGGTGIWAMHFIAMLGFSVVGMPVRYDMAITLLSLAMAIGFVFIGLAIVTVGGGRTRALLLGGVITGCGVCFMHYTGMAAMRSGDTMTYNSLLVGASVAIGVVAATAALWLCLNVTGGWAVTVSTPIMGIAVSGMHYTGMAALKMHMGTMNTPRGISTDAFITPLMLGIIGVTIVMSLVVMVSPTGAQLRAEAVMDAQMQAIQARRTSGAPY